MKDLPSGFVLDDQQFSGELPNGFVLDDSPTTDLPTGFVLEESNLSTALVDSKQRQDRIQMEHGDRLTPPEEMMTERAVDQSVSSLEGTMQRYKPNFPAVAKAAPDLTMFERVINKMAGSRGEVTPQANARALIAFQARQGGQTSKQFIEEVGPRTGPLERGLKDIGAGAAASGAGMLGFAARMSDNPGAQDIYERASTTAQDLMPSDPNFADQVLAGFGSTATFFVPGIGIAKGAQALSSVAPRMSMWLGSSAAAGMEAAAEAGQTYQQMLSEGRDIEAAKTAADQVFWGNAALVGVTNKLGLFGDHGGQLSRRSLGAAMEGGQEGGQQAISNVAQDKPAGEGVVESMAVGAIVGGGMSGNVPTPEGQALRQLNQQIENTQLPDPQQAAVQAFDPNTQVAQPDVIDIAPEQVGDSNVVSLEDTDNATVQSVERTTEAPDSAGGSLPDGFVLDDSVIPEQLNAEEPTPKELVDSGESQDLVKLSIDRELAEFQEKMPKAYAKVVKKYGVKHKDSILNAMRVKGSNRKKYEEERIKEKNSAKLWEPYSGRFESKLKEFGLFEEGSNFTTFAGNPSSAVYFRHKPSGNRVRISDHEPVHVRSTDALSLHPGAFKSDAEAELAIIEYLGLGQQENTGDLSSQMPERATKKSAPPLLAGRSGVNSNKINKKPSTAFPEKTKESTTTETLSAAGATYEEMYQAGATAGYEAPDSGTLRIGERVIKLPTEDKPMRRESIRLQLSQIIGPRLYEGKIKGQKRLGFYRPTDSTVRVKNYGDVEVMAHEMAHYLDFHSPFKRNFKALYEMPDVRNELAGLSYTNDKKLELIEGFAEFTRLWLTRYESVKLKAPAFTKRFEAELSKHKKLNRKMRKLQDSMHGWYYQGSEARLAGVMDGNQLSPTERAAYLLQRRPLEMTRQRYIDHIHAAKVVERTTKGKLLDASESAYKQLQLLNGIEGIFIEMTKRGAPYIAKDGEIRFKGPSIENVFRDSITKGKKTFKHQQEYFVARRAQELTLQGRENLLDQGMIDAGLARARKNPEFRKKFDLYQEYRKNLMDFMVETGYVEAQAAKNMLKKNKNYVPFNRVVEGISESFVGSGNFQRLKGGRQNLQNIYDNIVMGDFQHLKAALKSKALRDMYEFGLESQEGSRFFSKIDSDSKIVEAHSDQMAQKVARALVNFGVTITDGGLVMSGNLDGTVVDTSEIIAYFRNNPEELKFWSFGHEPKTSETKVTSFISSKTGKRVWIEIQREGDLLVDMLDNLDGWALPPGMFGKVMSAAYFVKNMQTVLITSMPQFQIPNVWRDVQTAAIISGGEFKPVYHNMLGFASMLGHAMGKHTLYSEMVANGGGFGGRARSALDETNNRSSHRMPGHWKKPELFLTNLLDLYVSVIDSPEMSTRAGFYIRSRKVGMTAREAAWRSREISTDFRKHGSSRAFVMYQRTMPFHGAFVQSFDRDIRAFAEKDGEIKLSNVPKTDSGKFDIGDIKSRMYMVAASFASVAFLLAVMNEDDDWYHDLTEDERVRFFHIKVNGERYSFPKPHGFFSVIFQAIEVTKDYMTQKEGAEAAKVMMYALAYNINSDFIPGIVNPPIEIALNKNFTGSPIVNEAMQDLSPELQYKAHTKQMYIEIGRQLKVSPLQAQHVVKGYLNYFENFIADTVELSLWNHDEWGDRPFKAGAKEYFGKQFKPRDVPYRTRWMERYYKLRQRATTASADLSALKKRVGTESRLFPLLDNELTQNLAALKRSFSVPDSMAKDLRDESIVISRDKSMTADEKESQINALRFDTNKQFKNFYQSIYKDIKLIEEKAK